MLINWPHFILDEHNLNTEKTMCHSVHYEDYNLLTYEYIVFSSRFLANLGLALSSCERVSKKDSNLLKRCR